MFGPNGAGKSTLLKSATGIIRLGSGRVTVWGDADELRHQEGKSIVAIMKEAFRHDGK